MQLFPPETGVCPITDDPMTDDEGVVFASTARTIRGSLPVAVKGVWADVSDTAGTLFNTLMDVAAENDDGRRTLLQRARQPPRESLIGAYGGAYGSDPTRQKAMWRNCIVPKVEADERPDVFTDNNIEAKLARKGFVLEYSKAKVHDGKEGNNDMGRPTIHPSADDAVWMSHSRAGLVAAPLLAFYGAGRRAFGRRLAKYRGDDARFKAEAHHMWVAPMPRPMPRPMPHDYMGRGPTPILRPMPQPLPPPLPRHLKGRGPNPALTHTPTPSPTHTSTPAAAQYAKKANKNLSPPPPQVRHALLHQSGAHSLASRGHEQGNRFSFRTTAASRTGRHAGGGAKPTAAPPGVSIKQMLVIYVTFC